MIWQDRPSLVVLLLSTLVRWLLTFSIGPGFDEAYYHLYSLNLSGGYFDHPPLVAFAAGLGHWLTGSQAAWTLRIGPILLFSLTLAGVYTLTALIYNRQAARLALLLPHISPYFVAGAGAFVLPDNALTVAWIWTLVVVYLLREKQIPETSGFVALGALLGLGLLAKYHAVLLFGAFGIACFYDRRFREFLWNWRLYLAFLVAILVFLPCILWNAENNWISFAEQFGKSASGEFKLRFDLIGQAVGGQLGYLTPWLGVLLWIGALKNHKQRSDGWLLPFFILPIAAFTLIGLTRGVLPHWTMPGYLTAFVLTAGWMIPEDLPVKSQHRLLGVSGITARAKRWLYIGIVINLSLLLLVIIQSHTGFIALQEKADPTLDFYGWEQTIEFLEEEGVLVKSDILFTHRWFTGGELAWADKKRHNVVLLNENPHMFAWWAPAQNYLGKSGWFITQERYGLTEEDQQKYLFSRFDDVVEIEIPVWNRGRQKLKMQVWRVEGFHSAPTLHYGINLK
ncbi:glycosyltransferase family 39 protein [bacterium]|nr:glycosyltransferase family 39 protein [bacterium]